MRTRARPGGACKEALVVSCLLLTTCLQVSAAQKEAWGRGGGPSGPGPLVPEGLGGRDTGSQ